MQVISNAFMDQVEIVSRDRWKHGPLELVFMGDAISKRCRGVEDQLAIIDWNRRHMAGPFRDAKTLETLGVRFPWLLRHPNPNVVLVPSVNGYTELHAMLATLLPEEMRAQAGFPVDDREANTWLWAIGADRVAPGLAKSTEVAFEHFIWNYLVRSRRLKRQFFRRDSPLRLLAGDPRFWMNRIYRVAIERAESFPEVTEDPRWESLEVLQRKLEEQVSPEQLAQVSLRRPLMGGSLWDPQLEEERVAVVDEAINGGGVLESLEPVIQAIHSHAVHEDFSDRYSWVKEDFERSFYSKRSKVKVTLLETVDNLPAWNERELEGYENVLFRDLLAFCDVRERRIILALRQGRTVSEIAQEEGLKGHAAISRRIKKLKAKLRPLLN